MRAAEIWDVRGVKEEVRKGESGSMGDWRSFSA